MLCAEKMYNRCPSHACANTPALSVGFRPGQHFCVPETLCRESSSSKWNLKRFDIKQRVKKNEEWERGSAGKWDGKRKEKDLLQVWVKVKCHVLGRTACLTRETIPDYCRQILSVFNKNEYAYQEGLLHPRVPEEPQGVQRGPPQVFSSSEGNSI